MNRQFALYLSGCFTLALAGGCPDRESDDDVESGLTAAEGEDTTGAAADESGGEAGGTEEPSDSSGAADSGPSETGSDTSGAEATLCDAHCDKQLECTSGVWESREECMDTCVQATTAGTDSCNAAFADFVACSGALSCEQLQDENDASCAAEAEAALEPIECHLPKRVVESCDTFCTVASECTGDPREECFETCLSSVAFVIEDGECSAAVIEAYECRGALDCSQYAASDAKEPGYPCEDLDETTLSACQ